MHVLQKLELDYNEMKSKIQAGAPLQQLKPLSVDSGEIVTGGNYIPAQVQTPASCAMDLGDELYFNFNNFSFQQI